MKRLPPIVALALLAFGCSSGTTPSTGVATTTTLTVFAASSLSGAFTQIGTDFEVAHPGAHVTFSFGPSDGLAQQIESEGTADVYASASGTWMDEVSTKVGVSGRVDFATNRLVIVTPPDNPAAIGSLSDLANPGAKVVLAAQGVPVGDYARQALDAAGLTDKVLANVVSNAQDDASAVATITSGEADAAIVYASDVTPQVAPEVHAVRLPDRQNVIATYPIAVVTGSTHPDLAAAFVAYVWGTQGQATLHTFGFLPVG